MSNIYVRVWRDLETFNLCDKQKQEWFKEVNATKIYNCTVSFNTKLHFQWLLESQNYSSPSQQASVAFRASFSCNSLLPPASGSLSEESKPAPDDQRAPVHWYSWVFAPRPPSSNLTRDFPQGSSQVTAMVSLESSRTFSKTKPQSTLSYTWDDYPFYQDFMTLDWIHTELPNTAGFQPRSTNGTLHCWQFVLSLLLLLQTWRWSVSPKSYRKIEPHNISGLFICFWEYWSWCYCALWSVVAYVLQFGHLQCASCNLSAWFCVLQVFALTTGF